MCTPAVPFAPKRAKGILRNDPQGYSEAVPDLLTRRRTTRRPSGNLAETLRPVRTAH